MANDDSILTDFLCGAIALVVVVVLSFITGGFSFFTPWVIWTFLALFVTGLARGNPEGSLWPKVMAINVSWIACSCLFLASEHWWVTPIPVVVTLLPAAAGVYLKSKFMKVPEP